MLSRDVRLARPVFRTYLRPPDRTKTPFNQGTAPTRYGLIFCAWGAVDERAGLDLATMLSVGNTANTSIYTGGANLRDSR